MKQMIEKRFFEKTVGKIIHIKRLKSDIVYIKKQWFSIATLAALLLLIKYKFHGLCTLRILTGIPCPACGMTRAALLFFTGHIRESISMHPAWPFVLVFAIVSFFYRYTTKEKAKYADYMYYGSLILLVMLLFLIYIYRMYEYFPNKDPMIYYTDNVVYHLLHQKK